MTDDSGFLDRLSRFVRSIETNEDLETLPPGEQRDQPAKSNGGTVFGFFIKTGDRLMAFSVQRRENEPHQQDRIEDQRPRRS